jgi:hypothetical protein
MNETKVLLRYLVKQKIPDNTTYRVLSGTTNIIHRGSTLVSLIKKSNLLLMITESPDRIGVTQRWSWAVSCKDASTTCFFHKASLADTFLQLTLLFHVFTTICAIYELYSPENCL